jgi:hypothetical protein
MDHPPSRRIVQRHMASWGIELVEAGHLHELKNDEAWKRLDVLVIDHMLLERLVLQNGKDRSLLDIVQKEIPVVALGPAMTGLREWNEAIHWVNTPLRAQRLLLELAHVVRPPKPSSRRDPN